jgi:hypothetical protein
MVDILATNSRGAKIGEQIPCPVATCRKPILANYLEQHIQQAHIEREEYIEQGKQTGHLHHRKKQLKRKSIF